MRTTDANLHHLYIHLKPGRRELWLSRETKSQLIRDRSDETSDENTVYRKPNLLPTNFFWHCARRWNDEIVSKSLGNEQKCQHNHRSNEGTTRRPTSSSLASGTERVMLDQLEQTIMHCVNTFKPHRPSSDSNLGWPRDLCITSLRPPFSFFFSTSILPMVSRVWLSQEDGKLKGTLKSSL